MPSFPANAFVALAAAAAWGGGDFSGGMGAKATGGTLRGALRIILLAHLYSLAVVTVVVLVQGHRLPIGAPLFWGIGAGIAAALSLAAFYLSLAQGAMGASAAVSGLLAAAIPVAVSVALQGAPGWMKAVGFAVALVAIWFIAAGETETSQAPAAGQSPMKLAVFGGVGFGVYFVALQRANVLGAFQPMMLARAASVLTCLVMLFVTAKRSQGPSAPLNRTAKRWVWGVALLDTAGNTLFITATRLGRLDVAAVLASLYPASTILLAAWRLHERPTRRQVFGMLLAVVAVALITL